MESFPLIVLLPLLTFALVIGFALWSRKRTQDKLDTPTPKAEKSSLAKDGPGPQPLR